MSNWVNFQPSSGIEIVGKGDVQAVQNEDGTDDIERIVIVDKAKPGPRAILTFAEHVRCVLSAHDDYRRVTLPMRERQAPPLG